MFPVTALWLISPNAPRPARSSAYLSVIGAGQCDVNGILQGDYEEPDSLDYSSLGTSCGLARENLVKRRRKVSFTLANDHVGR